MNPREPGNAIDDEDMDPVLGDDVIGAPAANGDASASRTGNRGGDDLTDIGSTEAMESSTGGLAGTSR
jgi:hypothetical protein